MDMCISDKITQANIHPDLIAAAQALPHPQEADVNADNMLPSGSMDMAPQLQGSVRLTQPEFLQTLTLS
jgi:hypothetical protein